LLKFNILLGFKTPKCRKCVRVNPKNEYLENFPVNCQKKIPEFSSAFENGEYFFRKISISYFEKKWDSELK